MTAKVLYKSDALVARRARSNDAGRLAPFVRSCEVRECVDLSGRATADVLPENARLSRICCTFAARGDTAGLCRGTVLAMAGVMDIMMPHDVSHSRSLLAGRGGFLWAVSRDEASLFRVEAVRRVFPLFFGAVFKAGYDYITTWCTDYMMRVVRPILRFGFTIQERFLSDRDCFYRLEWRRDEWV